MSGRLTQCVTHSSVYS